MDVKIPEVFDEMKNYSSIEDFFIKIKKRQKNTSNGAVCVRKGYWGIYIINKNNASEIDYPIAAEYREHAFNISDTEYLLYCDNDGNVWISKADIQIFSGNDSKIEIGCPKACKRLVEKNKYILLNSREEVIQSIKNRSEWLYKYLEEKKETNMYYEYPESLLMAPQIEQLDKAGFRFVEEVINNRGRMRYVDDFNRLCKPGNNLKEIFKISKPVYQILREEKDLRLWDILRKMDKKKSIDPTAVKHCMELNLKAKQINQVYDILSKTYNGKPVFTWKSLTNYLERLDNFEAIETEEALEILRDYLMMCRQLNMRPRVDGDSLKREHDIAARLCKKEKNEVNYPPLRT